MNNEKTSYNWQSFDLILKKISAKMLLNGYNTVKPALVTTSIKQ